MRTGENLYKRKDGRWEARYHKGRNGSGKLIYGFCYGKTYSEAKMKMEQAKADTAWRSQSCTTGMKRTFGYYCDLWLQMNKPRLHSSSFTWMVAGVYRLSARNTRLAIRMCSAIGSRCIMHMEISTP